jgi:hypothetical protein
LKCHCSGPAMFPLKIHAVLMSVFLLNSKAIFSGAWKGNSVVRHQGSCIFYTVDTQKAVRSLALRASRALSQVIFLILISVTGWVDPRPLILLEALGTLKNPIMSLGIELASFRLVAKCRNKLPYHVVPITHIHTYTRTHARDNFVYNSRRVKLSLCLFDETSRNMEAWRYGSTVRDFGTRCRWGVSFWARLIIPGQILVSSTPWVGDQLWQNAGTYED